MEHLLSLLRQNPLLDFDNIISLQKQNNLSRRFRVYSSLNRPPSLSLFFPPHFLSPSPPHLLKKSQTMLLYTQYGVCMFRNKEVVDFSVDFSRSC